MTDNDYRFIHDLRYCDESGFSLISNSPYAWQDKFDPLAVKSQRSQQFNVLGLMNIYGALDSDIFTGGTTSEVVIACIDAFSESCTKSTHNTSNAKFGMT